MSVSPLLQLPRLLATLVAILIISPLGTEAEDCCLQSPSGARRLLNKHHRARHLEDSGRPELIIEELIPNRKGAPKSKNKRLIADLQQLKAENALLASRLNLLEASTEADGALGARYSFPEMIHDLASGLPGSIVIINNVNINGEGEQLEAAPPNELRANVRLYNDMTGAFLGNNNAASGFGDVSRQNGDRVKHDFSGAFNGNNNGDVARQGGVQIQKSHAKINGDNNLATGAGDIRS
jgi:hypothetical protein